MCLSVFLIESGLQPEDQQSAFCHLPARRRVPGLKEQVSLLISTALFLLGKHWQNPAQEYHLAFLQHFTNTNQWAQHHQIGYLSTLAPVLQKTDLKDWLMIRVGLALPQHWGMQEIQTFLLCPSEPLLTRQTPLSAHLPCSLRELCCMHSLWTAVLELSRHDWLTQQGMLKPLLGVRDTSISPVAVVCLGKGMACYSPFSP